MTQICFVTPELIGAGIEDGDLRFSDRRHREDVHPVPDQVVYAAESHIGRACADVTTMAGAANIEAAGREATHAASVPGFRRGGGL
jgi:hypothetical protein